MDGLFREDAIKAHQPQWFGTTRLALPVSYRVWGLLSALAIIAIVGWLCLGHYTRREHVTGRLIPDAGLIRMTARSIGIVAAVKVPDNINPGTSGSTCALDLSATQAPYQNGDLT
ncbi:MAG TPA: hypothetical protein VFJ15_11625 [Oleiagrimonas sp.]|nr:hypothetical protein [Oleiagrimonas sp.]